MKNYHFILEGPDGVGKSTVAKLLNRIYKIPIIRQEIKTFENIDITSKVFNTAVVQFKQYPFILDRWWISSVVYAQVYNRPYTFTYIDDLVKILPNSHLIYLSAPTDVLLSRKKDELVNPKKLKEVNVMYTSVIKDHWYDMFFHKVIHLDTSKLSISKIEKILSF